MKWHCRIENAKCKRNWNGTAGSSQSMMTSSNGNIFRVAGPLCGAFIGDRWIPLAKASDADPNSKVHGANMVPTWVMSASDGPHVGPMNLAMQRSFYVSLICAWINDWLNNGEAGDFRRHRAHYDVTVMIIPLIGDHPGCCKCLYYLPS